MADEPPASGDAAPRYRRCETCGQLYDTADLDQVFHHGPEPHAPLPHGPPQD